jgi:thiamine biosynthesis lipoprotein
MRTALATRWSKRGRVRAHGVNADGRAWQIGMEQPDAMPQRVHYAAPLANRAMATSGDCRINFKRDGARYCHGIDPARRAPIDHGLASVTVVADDRMHVDALATALIVLGLNKGCALAEARGIAAYLIQRDGSALRDRMTSAFAALGGWRVAGA